MSKVIEEHVTSMKLDNSNFEQNARTSMSTLDKLKAKLNLKGAAKGLEEVNAASKKVNFKEMENAAYRSGFHVQDIWLKTASVLEYQVAGRIIDAGKNIAKALTITPITTGFQEYELKMGSVQTIMASTGESLETVNKYLGELNKYSDQTIYSFSDMTQNIGKFTNAGVKLEDAVAAIKGISNEAALSGANANEASRAMYNFAQALSSGYVKLIDWKSIENANMATVGFKQELIDTAVALGTLTEQSDGMYQTLTGKTLNATKNFNDTLQEQWMTSDVLVETLKRYADETTEIGAKASAAATEVKTFTMLFDTLKEAAQSGWAQTWELIIGDFEEAKSYLTELSQRFGGLIDKMSDARNNVLAGALNSKWDTFIEKVNEAGVSTDDFNEKLKETAKEHGIAIDEMIEEHGSLSRAVSKGLIPAEVFTDALKKLAEQAPETADAINKASEYIVQDGDYLIKIAKKYGTTWQELYELNKDIIKDPDLIYTGQILKLSDAQLENMGYTKEQIKLIKALSDEAQQAGTSVAELIERMEKPSGRELLWGSLRNIMEAITRVAKAVADAWKKVFPPKTVDEQADKLYNLINAIHSFTEKLVIDSVAWGKLVRTFRGVFSILDLIGTVIGGPLRIAFKIIQKILSMFNMDVLDLTAAIGDVLYAFTKWVKSILNFDGILEAVVPLVIKAADAVKGWINSIKNSKAFNDFIDRIRSITSAIRDWIVGMKDAEDLPQYIAKGIGTAIGTVLKFVRDTIINIGKFVSGGFKDIGGYVTEGFANGLGNGIKNVWNTIKNFANTIITTVCDILGIHSPSRVFFALAGFVVSGFILGFRDKIGEVWPALGEFANGVVNFIKNIDFGKVFATAGSLALAAFAYSIYRTTNYIGDALKGLGEIMFNAGHLIETFDKTINRLGKAISNSINASAAKQFAIAIAILVGSIIALALIMKVDGMIGNLWIAVGIIVVLAGVIAGLFAAINAVSKVEGANSKKIIVNMASMTATIIAIAGAILLITIACKLISDMSPDEMIRAGIGLLAISIAMVGLMWGTNLLAKSTSTAKTVTGSTKVTKDVVNVGKNLIGIAASLLIVVIAAKLIAGMEPDEMIRAGIGLAAIAVAMVGLMWGTKLLARTSKGGNVSTGINHVGQMLLKIAMAMLVMVIAAKIIAGMSPDEMTKAGIGLLALVVFVNILIRSTNRIVKTSKGNVSKDVTQIGTMLLSIATAMLVLVIAAKIIAGMEPGEMIKAGIGLLALVGFIALLVKATKLAGGNDLKGVGVTLLGMAAVIGVMAISAAILSGLDSTALGNAILYIGLLSLCLIGIVKATQKAGDAKGAMIGIAITIGVMAAALALLSFIKWQDLIMPVIGLGVLMGMLALVASQAGKSAGTMSALLGISAAIAVMAAALILLSMQPWQNVLASTVALGVLMAVLTIVLSQLSKVGKSGKDALRGTILLAALSVVLLILVASLAIMSGVQNALANTLILSGFVLAMIGLLALLKLIGKQNAGDALVGIILLTAMAVPLIAFVGVLAAMSGVKNALSNTGVLILLAAAMTVLLIPLGLIGSTLGFQALIGVLALTAMAVPLIAFVGVLAAMSGVKNAEANAKALVTLTTVLTLLLIPLALVGMLIVSALMGVVALTAMAVPLIAFVGVLAVMQGIQNAETNALALTALITAIGDTLIKLSLVAPLALLAVAAVNGLVGVIVTIGVLATAIGALMDKFPQLEEFLNKGLPLLEQIAGSIGRMIGNFVAGIAEGIASALPQLGLCLGLFMTNAMPFIVGAKMVDDAVLKGAGILAASVVLLTAADFVAGIGNFLGLGSSFADLGTELSMFMTNAMPFITGAAMIDPAMMAGVESLAKTILILTATDIMDSLTSWLTGGSSLADFGAQLAPFGMYMRQFADYVAGIDGESVKVAAEAGKTLAGMMDTIPNEGGILAWFSGENSLAAFGAQIASFGVHLAAFAASVAGINPENVKAAATAGKALTEMANTIPNQGGVASWFSGDNSLASFGPQIAEFGKSLADFSTNVAGINPENIKAAASVGKSFADMASNIPDGSKLELFGAYVASFGGKLGDFSKNVAGVNPSTIKTHVDSIKPVVELANSITANAGPTLKSLGSALATFGIAMGKFYKSMSGVSLGVLASSLEGLDDVLTKLNTTGQTEVKFSTGAEKIVTAFASTIISKKTTLTKSVNSMASGMASAIKLKYNEFKAAGKHLADGFAAGISANTWKASAKAVAMANAALQAAKNALKINSPSKVFRDEVGSSVPEGFAAGIDKFGWMVKDSTENMAGTAISGTKSAISRIAAAINSDIDAQPTIRPVMDLSDINSGADIINGLFDTNHSIGVMGNINAISSMMGNRQNVGNEEVISALKDLKSSLSGRTGDTYSINGITYDDGSAVSEAVRTLVQAARIERRV